MSVQLPLPTRPLWHHVHIHMAESEGPESKAKVKDEPEGGEERPAVSISAKIRLPEGVAEVLEYERSTNVSSDLRTRAEVQTLPTRLYLDYTVVAVLMDAMTAVDRTR